jgi:hypothetical protein
MVAMATVSLGQAAKAVHRALAGVVHQFDGALLAGLEAHGGAGGDVQAHAARGLAVEAQRAVGFAEVVVRADLDRAVTGVLHHQGQGAAPRVQRVFTLVDQKFSRNHGTLRGAGWQGACGHAGASGPAARAL